MNTSHSGGVEMNVVSFFIAVIAMGVIAYGSHVVGVYAHSPEVGVALTLIGLIAVCVIMWRQYSEVRRNYGG
ncbi:MAG: hypothetical protein WA058_01125 [Minisyncoccia bacterium]